MSQHVVVLKPRFFAAFSVGGCDVELFVDAITPGGVTVQIKSPKPVKALRVFQELPGMGEPEQPAVRAAVVPPPIAGDELGRKRAS